MVLDGHGHAPLFDGRVDISEIIAADPALEGVAFPQPGLEDETNGAVSGGGGGGHAVGCVLGLNVPPAGCRKLKALYSIPGMRLGSL